MWKFLLAAVLAFLSIVIFFPFLLFLDSTYIFIFIVIGAFIVLWIFNNNEEDEHNTNTDKTKRSPNINSNNQDIKTTKNTDFVVVDRKKEDEKLVKSIDLSNTVTDIDGNVYKTVQIGNQIWMAENLRVSKYRNGDIIPNVSIDNELPNINTGAWCIYHNNPEYDAKYGKLYNCYTIDDNRGLSPDGWHIPSTEEWEILFSNLGGHSYNDVEWFVPLEVIKNKREFNGKLAGYSTNSEHSRFENLGRIGTWFSKNFHLVGFYTFSYENVVSWRKNERFNSNFFYGSVRCVKYAQNNIDIHTDSAIINNVEYRSPILIPFRKGDKWGFCDEMMNIVIPCAFESVKPFNEDVAAISINKLWGLINNEGKTIVKCNNSKFEYTLNGYTVFSSWYETYRYSVYKNNGEELINNDEAIFFSENQIVIRSKTNFKWGVIDKDYNEKIPYEYDWIGETYNGFTKVCKNKKVGIIDNELKEIIPLTYDNIIFLKDKQTSNDIIGVCSNNMWGIIDLIGNEVLPCKYDSMSELVEGFSIVEYKNKWGYIDNKGNLRIPPIFDYVYSFYNGYAIVKYKGGWVKIDSNGVIVSPQKIGGRIYITGINYFENRITYLGDKNYGYLDLDLNIVIPCKYDKAGNFSDGMAFVKFNNKWGYIDSYGNEIIPFKYDGYLNDYEIKESNFHNGLALVQLNGKFGYIDKNGKEYWDNNND